MSAQHYLKKFKFIDCLISKKSTGSQKKLAKKIDVSVSTLNEYLHEMKELGFPIKYNHSLQTYYYEREGKMVDSLFNEDLNDNDMKSIIGGTSIFFATNEKLI